MDFPSHKLWSNFVIVLSRSDLPQCLGTVYLLLTIFERLTSWFPEVACPSASLEITFASSWPIFEETPLTNMSYRDFSNIDVTSLDQLNLVEISQHDCFRLTENWSVLSFCSTKFLDILLLDMIERNGLPLLKGVSGLLHLIGSIKINFPCSTEC